VFSLSMPKVSSFKTQIFYCKLKWRHVSTQGVIIRPIIEPCMGWVSEWVSEWSMFLVVSCCSSYMSYKRNTDIFMLFHTRFYVFCHVTRRTSHDVVQLVLGTSLPCDGWSLKSASWRLYISQTCSWFRMINKLIEYIVTSDYTESTMRMVGRVA